MSGAHVGDHSRRDFLKTAGAAVLAASTRVGYAAEGVKRPNILFAIADDWSWPHASILGAAEISTPNFDRVAREGCLFNTCYTAAPQCSPNRAALLTGRPIWSIEEAGTHASIFPNKYPVFTDALTDTGYHVGYTCKPWGPGDWRRGGWSQNPVGNEYNEKTLDDVPADGIKNLDYAGNFEAFLADRDDDQPFCFWYGASEPHRRYEYGSGVEAGKELTNVDVPAFLPDTEVVRNDILDYYLEIEWFDAQLGRMLAMLDERGELENTLVIVTSDNGMPFPGAKANLYDFGVHAPLAVRWPARVPGGRRVDDAVSFIDLGPTMLDAAGVTKPVSMYGRSFMNVLTASEDGQVDPSRDAVYFGRERHTHARYDNWGYPARGVRSGRYLYIRNFKPDRWPAGDPPDYHDIDGGATKTELLEKRDEFPALFAHSVGKRPAEELFDVTADPACMHNLAGEEAFADVRADLAARLDATLLATNDPRVLGRGDVFESYPRVSHMRPELGGFAERGAYNPAYRPNDIP